MEVRGKIVLIGKHAHEGMAAERPPLDEHDILAALETPDHDDGRQAGKRIGKRTIIVYYEETQDGIEVRSISATRSRLAP